MNFQIFDWDIILNIILSNKTLNLMQKNLFLNIKILTAASDWKKNANLKIIADIDMTWIVETVSCEMKIQQVNKILIYFLSLFFF